MKKREKISLGMSVFDVVTTMSEGNPGALTVMMRLMEKRGHMDGIFDILSLDDMNMRGSQIWVAYKDYCGQDIEKFIVCIKERDQAMVDAVNACEGTGTTERAVTHSGSWR